MNDFDYKFCYKQLKIVFLRNAGLDLVYVKFRFFFFFFFNTFF